MHRTPLHRPCHAAARSTRRHHAEGVPAKRLPDGMHRTPLHRPYHAAASSTRRHHAEGVPAKQLPDGMHRTPLRRPAVRRPVPPDRIMRKGFLQNDCPTACAEPRCAGPAMRRPVPPDGIMRKGFLQSACILAIIRFTYFVPIKRETRLSLPTRQSDLSAFPCVGQSPRASSFSPGHIQPRCNHLEHRRAHLRPSSIMARVPGDEVEAQPPGPNDRRVPSTGRGQPISP